MRRLMTILRIMRPANIITAFADIFAGFGISGLPSILQAHDQWLHVITIFILLLISTAGLYSAGVVFNDVFDAELDFKERPERPIPRNLITKKQATILATTLMTAGIIAACMASYISGLIAISIASLSLLYDSYSKHSLWLGPINMGICRGLNLLLGISIVVSMLAIYWPLMAIPFIFIAGVTLTSKGEVHGTSVYVLLVSLFLYLITICLLIMLVFTPNFHIIYSLPYLLLFSFLTFYSLITAILKPAPLMIRKAVKMGIISLIILDATIASGYTGWWYGLFMLILLGTTLILAKLFPVT